MGKACTFFGHHDCPSSIKPKLREVLIDLIENHAVDMFYVGQQGAYQASGGFRCNRKSLHLQSTCGQWQMHDNYSPLLP